MPDSQHDLVIRGGTIVDGSGAPAFHGDVAIDGDWIVAVGEVPGRGMREIDAGGLIVTPGFVDIHTHYDGQMIWSDRLTPSSQHGVTTVVTGNCGIGFAPCRTADRTALIQLMEGVEDIPEAVSAEGLDWSWETFPEFLDAVERRPHDIDVAAMLPHSSLRVYVMGDRAVRCEPATDADLAWMQALTAEALAAGAVGVGTSRLHVHRSSSGDNIPTFDAAERELLAIAGVLGQAGEGVFQLVTAMTPGSFDAEFALMRRVAGQSGCPVTYTQAQARDMPDQWQRVRTALRGAADDGLTITAQLFPRPIGMIVGLSASVNPFCLSPSWAEIRDLPLAQKVARMRDPAFRARIIAEPPGDPTNPLAPMSRRFDRIFALNSDAPDYEPASENSIAARAERLGIAPEELVYDLLLEKEGAALLLMALGNYEDGNLDFMPAMFRDKHVVVGLGDGGAHYGMICDASYPTFVLTHWTRDRKGERFSIEEAVRILTRAPAEVFGLLDRGLLRPGHRAHVNVIDHARMRLYGPEIVHDLPAGGRRLDQGAQGYVAIIVNGALIVERDRPTGLLPGRLLRGRQQADQARELSEVA